jgi:selenocysteine-specific elongation factor
MIIATAGHVDHGKTLLVKALTGIDADRLPEEKQRGMTIDLGFAYMPVAGQATVGFIDVPGHERFIRNMLCGVAAVDFVLLIVAADDGPMPQTVEHVAILDLLGVRCGAVAVTKIDRVEPRRIAEIERDIAALLAGTTLAGAPLFPVSAVTGLGIEALKQHLVHMARQSPQRPANGNFRMAIDRSFSIVGAGPVVTGTVVAGAIAVGDQVSVVLAGLQARVRTIHAQNAPSMMGQAGQRCALNLAGDLHPEQIGRGDWAVTGNVPPPVAKIDARLRVLASEKRPFQHWTPVHVHSSAADVTGRVAILEGASIAPGRTGLVQLVLDRPIGALRGDPLITRDQSAQRTIGGGRVIDVFPPARGRAKPERRAAILAMESDRDDAALLALLSGAPKGLDLTRFAANRNLASGEADVLFHRIPMRSVTISDGVIGFSPDHWQSLKKRILEALAAWHRRAPDTVGPAADRILAGTELRLPGEVMSAAAAELVRDGAIVKEGAALRLPSHMPKLTAADAALWKKIAPLLDETALRAPALHEIAATVGEDPRKIESFLVRTARLGLLVRLTTNRFVRPAALRRLGTIAEEVAAASPDRLVTAAAFRDRSAIGRNMTIEVLEYFDRVHFTRRIGDARELLRPAASVFGEA